MWQNLIPVNNLLQTLLKLFFLRKTNTYLLNDYFKNLIDSYILCLYSAKKHMFWRICFFPFLKKGFIFETFPVFGKTSCEIEGLQGAEMGFNKLLAPSLKNLQKRLSISAVLRALNICHYFRDFSLGSIAEAKIVWNC